ncbi:MAG: hypothetical protein NC433_16950 [Clostridiales bacterium]|nr:hypothetical protein [Clostridiales bacterium]
MINGYSDGTIVEVNTGTQIEKYEYISGCGDLETCIVHSDDIDLSKEGFMLEYNEHYNYGRNLRPVNKKCKLVKKKDVVKLYRDWSISRSYYCGVRCSYEKKDGFIRIEIPKVKGLINEFICEEYYPSEYSSLTSTRYYKNIPYDDVKFLRNVITKCHKDCAMNLHEITKETNEEKKKQLLIEYLIKTFDKRTTVNFRQLLFGTYGYKIPDKLYSTDVDTIFDVIFPRLHELSIEPNTYKERNFLRDLSSSIVNSHWTLTLSDSLWFEDGKRIYPSEEYKCFMNILFHLKLIEKHRNKEYPYILLGLKNNYHWLKHEANNQYLTNHNPVYWNDKLICDDLGNFLKEAWKELIYFKQFDKST